MPLFAAKRRIDESAPEDDGATRLEPELMARVRRIRIRTHRLVTTALSGGYRSTFRGSGLEFSDVRAYQPGDEVRRIDWNVTARTGHPFVKNYAEERELTVQLVVDTSRSMDFGSRKWTKREAAAQLAALVSFVALRNQDRVGLLLFGEEPGLHLRPRKGGQHALRVVREVLAARPTAGGSGLAPALEHASRVMRRRSVVLVVSDFHDALTPRAAGAPDWPELMGRLALRHDLIAVRVFDPLERELPRSGLVDLAEIESGARAEVDAGSKRVREAWRSRAAERKAAIDAALARGRADVLELDASRDVGEALAAFFRRRASRKGAAR